MGEAICECCGNNKEENKWLKRRVAALDKLLVVYRCQSRPTEKLMDELAMTKRNLEKLAAARESS